MMGGVTCQGPTYRRKKLGEIVLVSLHKTDSLHITGKIIFMCPEWNSGASSFCPVCDSVCLSVCDSVAKKNPLTLAITFEP